MDLLKRLFGKDDESSSSGAFKGRGQRLGGGDMAKHAAAARKPAPGKQPVASRSAGTASAGPATLDLAPAGQDFQANTPTGKELRQLGLQRNARLLEEQTFERSSSLTADIANRRPASLTTISDPTLRERLCALSVSEHSGPMSGRASTDGTGPAPGDVYALQHSLALVVSHPQHAAALCMLARILHNILANPFESKYRQVKLSNPKVQSQLLAVHGAVQFLQACGFEITGLDTQQAGAQPSGDGVAELPSMSALGPAETGWQELCGVMHAHGVTLPFKAEGAELGHRLKVCHTAAKEEPGDAAACPSRAAPAAHGGQSQGQGQGQGPGSGAGGAETSAATVAAARAELAASQAAAASAAVDRETQVILPVAPDTEVPDWFFDLTGAEVKAEYLKLQKNREASQQFVPKVLRQRNTATATPATATIRVRFPEGVCLQGQFRAGEPVLAIHTWLGDALRSPAITYELVDPSRKALPRSHASVREAGLAPSAVLNFRATGSSASDFARLSCLSDQLLRQVHASY